MDMSLTVFVVGPAGSGKSTFSGSFSSWLSSQNIPVTLVNLDPAVENLQYLPDIDIREYVFVRNIMEKYALGPNGAIIASIDLSLEYLDKIKEEMRVIEEGYILIDTPGQLEIFAFRSSGKYIVEELCLEKGRCVILFIADSLLATDVNNFISQLFLISSIFYRFGMPMISLFNKIDLLSKMEVENINKWLTSVDEILSTLEDTERGVSRVFTKNILLAISDFVEMIPPILISSKTQEGFAEIYSQLQRIYMGGEDFEVTSSYGYF